MNRKRLLIIVGGILILIIILFLVYLSNRTSNKLPTGVPTFNPTPTEKPLFSSKDLIVVQVDPPEDLSEKNNYPPIQQIVVTFNKELVQQTLNVTVSPELELKTTIKANQLTIQPKPPLFWMPNTIYIITIKAGSQAADGSVLKNDFIYRISPKLQGGGE